MESVEQRKEAVDFVWNYKEVKLQWQLLIIPWELPGTLNISIPYHASSHILSHGIECRGAGYTSVPQNIPSETESLDLSENPLFELSDFPQLEKLKALYITNLALTTLSSGAFKALRSLQFLDLSFNVLKSIPRDLGAPSLEALILLGNAQLDFLNETGPIFSSSTLKTLDLSHCFLTNLPHDAFSSLPSLKHLSLHNNLLMKLPPNIFKPLKFLTSLDLSDNILSVPKGTFQHNQFLLNLNVSYNPLYSKAEDPLIEIQNDQTPKLNDTVNVALLISPSIEILDLSMCMLTSLYAKSLAYLPKLRHLYIINNKLKHIDPTAFKDLFNLEILHISWVKGVRVFGDIFKNNEKLTSLKCPTCFTMNTKLTSTSISDLDCSSLYGKSVLHLSSNASSWVTFRLSGLDFLMYSGHSDLTNLPSLSIFRIGSVDLYEVSERIFTENPLLRIVDFSHNRLRTIPRRIFSSNVNITEIILAGNNLGVSLSGGPIFTPCAAVHLDLSKNLYRLIEKNYFSGLESLVTLNLSMNPLFGWEEGAFSELYSLEVLDLSQTHLLHLHPDSFITNMATKHLLHLPSQLMPKNSSLPMSNYSFHLLHIKTLKVLDLSNSKIFYLPNSTFSGTPSLEKLVLSNNKLRAFDLNILNLYLPNLTYLDLTNNPWRCDCSLAQLRDFREKRNMEPHYNLVICDKPESLHGHSWDAIIDCANFTTDVLPKIVHKNTEASTRKYTQTQVIKTEKSREDGNSYNFPSNAYNEGHDSGKYHANGGSHLPTENGSEKEHSDFFVSQEFSASNPKKSFFTSVSGGVLMGFISMSVVLSIGYFLYTIFVKRIYVHLQEDHNALELDL
ncbi:insulin-like growth factor-binding protein complex acid labile subunit [Hetaerina americana]|uniref:insulin-like growth factor-binding protein complex acid labile subunit n=1 Tax=Hetaerina americana TaxID=62018 RepID=UPI003A7F56C2